MSIPTSANYTVSQGDTARSLTYTLLVGSTPVDLTYATCSLKITNRIGANYNRAVTVLQAASGSVQYDLVAQDTAVQGTHMLQFVVNFNDGTVLNVPTNPILMEVILAVGGSKRPWL